MEKKNIVQVRNKLVQACRLLQEANEILLQEFQQEMIDCGNGCKIPKPELPDRCTENKSECCGR